MAAVDTSAKTKRDEAANLYTFFHNFGSNTLASALVTYDSGSPLWNEVESLYSAVGAFYNSSVAVVNNQTDVELANNWAIASQAANIPAIRTDITATNTALAALLSLIELNVSRMSFTLIRSPSTSKTYDSLTNGEKAAVKAELDSIKLTMNYLVS